MENTNEKSLMPTNNHVIKKLSNCLIITNKILENDLRFDWSFIFEHKIFFNRLFSTFYPFNEHELDIYSEKLEIGSEMIFDDFYIIDDLRFGLIYNKNLTWTESLKSKYYKEPELVVTENADNYTYNIDFNKLPIEISQGIISQDSYYYQLSYQSCEYEDYSESVRNSEEYKMKLLEKVTFSDREIVQTIQKSKYSYFENRMYYDILYSKILRDLNDFSIAEFYNQF